MSCHVGLEKCEYPKFEKSNRSDGSRVYCSAKMSTSSLVLAQADDLLLNIVKL